jgi:pimeloyl-ACP methyl ester carboxylesterase
MKSDFLSRGGLTTAPQVVPRIALLFAFVSAIPASLGAQETVAGTWRGDLPTPAGALTLVISLEGSGGSVSVPSRNVEGIPVTDLALSGDGSLSFQVPADRAAFEGRLTSTDTIAGEWVQAGQRIPLELTRIGDAGAVPAARVRSQTPLPPFPYSVEEVTLAAEERLGCTLTRPHESFGAVPGVVLLTVAGANDRDQTHSGHKPFMVLADYLTRSGMAVLRCDDRGVGGSTGEVTSAMLDDLVADALVMVRDLRARPGVGAVGIIGNSEGSVVASLAAGRTRDEVQFIVLLGGVGVRGADVIRERLRRQALDAGSTPEQADEALVSFDALTAAVLDGEGVGVDRLREARPDVYDRLVEIARTAGARDPFLPQNVDDRVALFAGSWYYSQLSLDGGATLESVQVPVLALTGSKDRTNLPEQNLPAIRAALTRAGNPDAEVTEVPDLNHVFQTAVVGGMAEYGRLEESFSPLALQIISRWIERRFGPTGAAAR